ncbi:rRNA methyltransferase [Saccharopolyspora hordei]|uniref:16S rRNA (Adenine(1408)-N(1))-methyltransferase n=1 Tax=Saccharopolyspora hordei TaxID=1838 RepID=A0A853AHG2_9PSEU|nr:rRNA methyltransferase [Saccharopolyspora hordei]NYI83575.1 16S rRNA (adenine(1408)-N(1))-methyltransferase [Saccharopolyspora hordei]
MRRVVGKNVVEFAAEEFAAMVERHPGGVVLDVGAGNAKHAYRIARDAQDTLVIALDAAKDNMQKVAGKAAASPKKGGAPNLLCVWAAAEDLPPELHSVTELHCLMPWGSLLRGMLGSDAEMLRGLARRCVPGATFLVTLNLHAWRPPVPEVGEHPEPTPDSAMEQLAPYYADAGWTLEGARYFGAEELEALATSWTRRLGSTRDELDVLGLTGVIGK